MGSNSSSSSSGAASSFSEDRTDRFVQSAQDGITVYSKAHVDGFVKQFKTLRRCSFSEIRQQLATDLQANKHNLNKYWSRASQSFNEARSKFRSALKKADGTNFPHECHIAIICYSMGYGAQSVYWKFNEECRDVCKGAKQLSQMSNVSIFLIFRYVMEKKGYNKKTEPSVFYRGAATKYKGHAGGADDLVSFGSFTSTSIKGSTAAGFAGSYGAVFVISNDSDEPTKFISLEKHSEFPYEKEYLLSPFQLFTVVKVKQQGDKQMVYLNLY